MEDLYNIIGKLYVDIFQAQKYITILQDEHKEKDKIIAELRIELKKLDDRQ